MSEWVSAVSTTADKKLAIKVTVNPPIHLDKLDLLFHVALEVSARSNDTSAFRFCTA